MLQISETFATVKNLKMRENPTRNFFPIKTIPAGFNLLLVLLPDHNVGNQQPPYNFCEHQAAVVSGNKRSSGTLRGKVQSDMSMSTYPRPSDGRIRSFTSRSNRSETSTMLNSDTDPRDLLVECTNLRKEMDKKIARCAMLSKDIAQLRGANQSQQV